jgi:hypothetical protein
MVNIDFDKGEILKMVEGFLNTKSGKIWYSVYGKEQTKTRFDPVCSPAKFITVG